MNRTSTPIVAALFAALTLPGIEAMAQKSAIGFPRDQIALQLGAIQLGYVSGGMPFVPSDMQKAANALAQGRIALSKTSGWGAVNVIDAKQPTNYGAQLDAAVLAVMKSPVSFTIKGKAALNNGKMQPVTARLSPPPAEWSVPLPYAISAAAPAGPVGPAGPAGPVGPPGPQGEPGESFSFDALSVFEVTLLAKAVLAWLGVDVGVGGDLNFTINSAVVTNHVTAGQFIGGSDNFAEGFLSSIAAGSDNTIDGEHSFIGGGTNNFIAKVTATGGGFASVVGGGRANTVREPYAFIGSGFANTNNSWGGVIAGGESNTVFGEYATVGGGAGNRASANHAAVGGGRLNWATHTNSTVAGGLGNDATGFSATVGGGSLNEAAGSHATIAGGLSNRATANYAAVCGGTNNLAGGEWSFVGGGDLNSANGDDSVVSGGYDNSAGGDASTVPGGARSKADDTGSFVWSGDFNENTESFGDFTFTVRCEGGARFYTADGTNVGLQLAAGDTQWLALSDREAKTDFEPVNKREILAKVAAMPVTSWYYKHNHGRRYIGPMAQDFHAAFGLGADDKRIGTLDSDGVMYAAIQGLVEELKERDKTIAELKMKSAEVEMRNEELSHEIKAIRERLDSLPPH